MIQTERLEDHEATSQRSACESAQTKPITGLWR